MRSIVAKSALVLAAALAVSSSLARADDPAAKAKGLIDKGLAFLKTSQQADGGWQKDPREPVGITALALRAFVDDGTDTAKTDFVAKGLGKMLSYQSPEGGISTNVLASYNTAIAIATLTAAKDPAFQPQIDKAVAYLKNLQWTTGEKPAQIKTIATGETDPYLGGWSYDAKGGTPDLSNTQFAIEALKNAGVSADDPAMKTALKFVTRCQNNSETNDMAYAGNDGGFMYGPGDDRKGESDADEVQVNGKRTLRTMGSMSYAGLKSMVYAGLSKDDPRVRSVWAWINKNFTLEENVGLAITKPENKTSGIFYMYMTMARALSAYGEPTLTDKTGKTVDWRVTMIDKLASLQNADGSWAGIPHEMENNKTLVTSYSVIALENVIADLKTHPAK